jgi:hypothetical protein
MILIAGKLTSLLIRLKKSWCSLVTDNKVGEKIGLDDHQLLN